MSSTDIPITSYQMLIKATIFVRQILNATGIVVKRKNAKCYSIFLERVQRSFAEHGNSYSSIFFFVFYLRIYYQHQHIFMRPIFRHMHHVSNRAENIQHEYQTVMFQKQLFQVSNPFPRKPYCQTNVYRNANIRIAGEAKAKQLSEWETKKRNVEVDICKQLIGICIDGMWCPAMRRPLGQR